ncbi:MAG: hypothetical protein ACI8S6_000120 [Myxococcota bacterium]
MSGLAGWLVVLGCGRSGRPLPAAEAAAAAITLDALRLAPGGVEVVLGCPRGSMTIERAAVAAWRGDEQLGEGESIGGCIVQVPAAGVQPGEQLRLTGAVVGSYWPGQRAVMPVRLSGEVLP